MTFLIHNNDTVSSCLITVGITVKRRFKNSLPTHHLLINKYKTIMVYNNIKQFNLYFFILKHPVNIITSMYIIIRSGAQV